MLDFFFYSGSTMADGGSSSGLPFQPKEDEYNIELEENIPNPPDGYGIDDRSRCKRRKRCGQCGPCQVKENCMKCHFCIRKDVLKQTCIYRKCVYLRSKPKPYSRPNQSPHLSGRLSPARDMGHPTPMVKSPPVSGQGQHSFGSDQGMHMSDIRPENPFLQHLPHQQQPALGAIQNHGYSSPPNPMMSSSTNNSTLNMSMQMNMVSPLQNHASSPPLQKLPEQSSPHVNASPSVNSPSGAAMSTNIPQVSSVGSVPQAPAVPPVVSAAQSPVVTSSSLPGMPPIPSIPTMPGINDRPAINEFRHPDQLPLHHPHHPFPTVPGVHHHMPHREPNLFGDHARISHMNFNPANHMDTFSRGPGDSSCMYHPGLSYPMPGGPFQPGGPSFLSGAADMNPFRSNFINSFPPGYSYPPDRYREGFGSLPFPRLGMSSPSFPQYPGQGAGYGMGNSFSQQYSPYNSQHGCPKNGSRPPVSPSIDDVKVLQEGYESCKDDSTRENNGISAVKEEVLSDVEEDQEFRASSPSDSEHSRLWNYYGVDKYQERSSSRLSEVSKSSFWEPWRMPYLYSPRKDDARSRTCSSTVSSDLECEISIDDHPLNALVRSDGCNSIEIEFDSRSMYSEESSPRKLTSRSSTISDFITPDKRSARNSLSEKSLMMSSYKKDSNRSVEIKRHSANSMLIAKTKHYVKGKVSVKQDLGEEGNVQLELPGYRVTIENVEFTEEYLNKSSNVAELKEFLSREADLVKESESA